jgi:adenylate kinase
VGVMVRLVMLGPPGAGKGTQAEQFAASRGVPRISTGDILREAVEAGTPLGLAAKAIMDAGRLVADDVIIGIARERLSKPDAARGFVLDGFPRTVAQADALDAIVDGKAPLVIVEIVVPEETLVRRLSTRRICVNCGWTATPGATVCGRCGGKLVARRDDDDAVVRERLEVHRRLTGPLVEHYRSRSTFRQVQGDQTATDVSKDIAAAVESVIGARA